MAADWRALVLHRPWLYLRVRWGDFVQVVFTPDIAACRPIFTGIKGAGKDLLHGLG